MNTFSNIKELVLALNREQKLLSEMFKKRKSLAYKYDYALELVNDEEHRIQFLIDKSVLRQNGNCLEIDDQFLQFFEQVLEVNEEINTSFINESIQTVKENILYYLQESNEKRKYNYLRLIKNSLRRLGITTLRNVVDLKRNIETTFKNEPNYKIKKARLENLDQKRVDITHLIELTEKLIADDEITFFQSAADEELGRIITQLKLQLLKCSHNLIETEKQIIVFLNQIKYQSQVIEKLRQIKYLKDQFTLQASSNIDAVLNKNNATIFESKPSYPLKISLEYLQTNEEALESIRKIANRKSSRHLLAVPLAGKISEEYLETQVEEEVQILLEEVRNGFLASGNNLFDFVIGYEFAKNVSFDERVTVYCQLISQFEPEFEITNKYASSKGIEFAMVYPK